MFPLVSVVIVNYNAGAELSRCVQSLAATGEDVEVVVVDNASRDDSLQKLLAAGTCGSRLHLVENTRNLGFAVACNQGSRIARSEYLLYLNPDCLVEPGTIPTLIACLRQYPGAGMAGGLILNPDGSEQRGCRRSVPTPWKSLVNSLGLYRLAKLNRRLFADFRLDRNPLPATAVEVDAISGACMLVSRKAREDVGPMDEKYFLHCEDLDWCMRFRQKGWKVMFEPRARLFHRKGSCSASRPVFVEWSKHKGMARFHRKFFAARSPWVLNWLVQLGIWLRFCLALGRIFLHRLFGPGKENV